MKYQKITSLFNFFNKIKPHSLQTTVFQSFVANLFCFKIDHIFGESENK